LELHIKLLDEVLRRMIQEEEQEQEENENEQKQQQKDAS